MHKIYQFTFPLHLLPACLRKSISNCSVTDCFNINIEGNCETFAPKSFKSRRSFFLPSKKTESAFTFVPAINNLVSEPHLLEKFKRFCVNY